MRLLARLEYEPESCASWYVIFRQSPYVGDARGYVQLAETASGAGTAQR
jgi:hypothetical protein